MRLIAIPVIVFAGIFCTSTVWAEVICRSPKPREAFKQAELVLIVKNISVRKLPKNIKDSDYCADPLRFTMDYEHVKWKYKVIKILKGTMPNSTMEYKQIGFFYPDLCESGSLVVHGEPFLAFLRVKNNKIETGPFFAKELPTDVRPPEPCFANAKRIKNNQVVLDGERISVDKIAEFLGGDKKNIKGEGGP